jgi:hypothetical protein
LFRLIFVAIGLVWLAALPDAAHACAACFDANEENRQAFIATTAFLTLLPLGMVTGAGLWLRKLARQLGQEEERRGSPDA